MSSVIQFVYEVMLSKNPISKIGISNGSLKWENGKGHPVYDCHRDKGFILRYWNYK